MRCTIVTAPDVTRHIRRRHTAAVVFMLAAFAVPQVATAQSPGTLLGAVRDVDGMPIEGASITISGSRANATTDGEGLFRLARLEPGRVLVQLRRIGFRPTETSVVVAAGGTTNLELTLDRIVPVLDPVHVDGTRDHGNTRMTGFYQRRERGLGHFITRDEIERRNPFRTTDLLRTIPGVRLRSTPSRSSVSIRSASCPPLVYIDGAPAAAAPFDPDLIAPASIEAIEVYSGPSTVPPQFNHTRWYGSCGVIVIWSRFDAPAPRRRNAGENARRLGDLIERNRIFTADQVDVVAAFVDSIGARPAYPERLLFEGAGGTVVAEFVVDTLGRVEKETLGLVSATHPAFADAVMSALLRTAFRPAMKGGHLVRQLVQQPFTFDPGEHPPAVRDM